MPIYEFYCPKCNIIFNFFSKSINTEKTPSCPRCGKTRLERRMSLFALSKTRGEEEETPLPDADESKIETAMNLLLQESENIDQNDPRQAVNLMRKFTDMTGISMGSGVEEALTRIEAGEDPEKIEEEMGDILEQEEPFALKKKTMKAEKQRPPEVDEKLYDL